MNKRPMELTFFNKSVLKYTGLTSSSLEYSIVRPFYQGEYRGKYSKNNAICKFFNHQ